MCNKLKQLWQDMANHTKAKCLKTCKLGMGYCCSSEYCEMALLNMKEAGEKLPLKTLDENGNCVIPPHFRPLCSLHQCKIASVGIDVDDPEWTDKYFELRDNISKEQEKENGSTTI